MSNRIITHEELKAHATKDSFYLLIHGKVYDATAFIDEHPGGDELLLAEAGKDATEAFEDIGHSDEARDRVLPPMYIGDIVKTEPVNGSAASTPSVDNAAENGSGEIKKMEKAMREVMRKEIGEFGQDLGGFLDKWLTEHQRGLEEFLGKQVTELQQDRENLQKAMDKKVAELQLDRENLQEAMDKKVEELQRDRENLQEAMNKKVEELQRELEEQKNETEGFRKSVVEMQSKAEEDRRHVSSSLPLDRSSPDFSNRLNKVLHGQEYERCVRNFQKDDLAWLVDYLDKALDSLGPSDPASRKCMRELRTICGDNAMLPTSYTISPHLLTIDPTPFASGGFGEVHHGTLEGSPVCVKRLRLIGRDALVVATRMFCQEAVMWRSLKNRNILPLLGATISPPQLVSTFMPAGDLSTYITKNPDANRVGFLYDIINGLSYLHRRNVIHGDLKGVNILVEVVKGHPNALIADFGIATVTKNLDSIRPATHQNIHTPRWSAPEVLREENPTKESDIYSFGMLMIEVFTNELPFNDKPVYMAVVAVLSGERPPRPTHASCSDVWWALIQHCWNQDLHLRPTISEVTGYFLID